MIQISIIDDVLDEKFWDLRGPYRHLSGHMYRNSPYETDDSCGNCDGARCDYCREYIEPLHLECSIPVDVLEDLLKKHGVPDEDASNIVYDDYAFNESGDYHFHFPNEDELQEKHKEFYDKLKAPDEELWKKFDKLHAEGKRAFDLSQEYSRNENGETDYEKLKYFRMKYSLWEDERGYN